MKFGFEYIKAPLILSSEISKFVFKFIPLPRKFFSVIPPPIVEPLEPTPAANTISPVGCSSTIMSMFFKFSFDPSVIEVSTFLKIPNDFFQHKIF